jgi:hypothetical protein
VIQLRVRPAEVTVAYGGAAYPPLDAALRRAARATGGKPGGVRVLAGNGATDLSFLFPTLKQAKRFARLARIAIQQTLKQGR